MLTIEECRKLIDSEEQFSDEQIMEIRDSLYELATLAFEVREHETQLSQQTLS
jgi:hypothetical protein